MPNGALDRETLDAVGVLVRAVERERVPGVLECRLLINALRRATESGRVQELNEASRVFRTLDPDLRERIVARAQAEAQAEAMSQAKKAGVEKSASPVLKALGPRPKPSGSAGSGFLAALNGLRPGGLRPGKAGASNNAARDRLRATVDDQRQRVSGD